MTCNQNNVIDITQYQYDVTIVDENGANSIAGSNYWGLSTSYTSIQNMAFP